MHVAVYVLQSYDVDNVKYVFLSTGQCVVTLKCELLLDTQRHTLLDSIVLLH